EREGSSILQGQGGHAISICGNPIDLGVEVDRSAKVFEEPRHSGDQRAGAALGEPDAALSLQSMDQGIDRGRVERVSTDQKRMEAEGLPQLLVLNEFTYFRIDTSIALEAQQLRRDLQHRPDVE